MKLPLPNGNVALVDKEDYEELKDHRWFLGKTGYVVYSTHKPRGTVYMHRLLKDAPKGMIVDHINGDKLDNRRANLRITTVSVNAQNMHAHKSKSGHRGVYWSNQNKKWNAQICIKGKSTSLGFFDELNDALKARIRGELEHWGHSNRETLLNGLS